MIVHFTITSHPHHFSPNSISNIAWSSIMPYDLYTLSLFTISTLTTAELLTNLHHSWFFSEISYKGAVSMCTCDSITTWHPTQRLSGLPFLHQPISNLGTHIPSSTIITTKITPYLICQRWDPFSRHEGWWQNQRLKHSVSLDGAILDILPKDLRVLRYWPHPVVNAEI